MMPSVSSGAGRGPVAEPSLRSSEAMDRASSNDGRRLAWQREMERAQTEAWFLPFAPPTGLLLCGASLAPVAASVPSVLHGAATRDVGPAARTDDLRPIGDSPGATASHDLAVSAETVALRPTDKHGTPGESTAEPADAGAGPATSVSAPAPAAIDAATVASADGLQPAGAAEPSSKSAASPPVTTGAWPSPPASARLEEAATLGAQPSTSPQTPDPTRPPASDVAIAVPSSSATSLLSATLPSRVVEPSRLAEVLRSSMAPAEPIQLHVEWSGSNATVWIGLAASASGRLSELIDLLARGLSKHGLRLRSVVCNGTPCHQQIGADDASSGGSCIDIQLITPVPKE